MQQLVQVAGAALACDADFYDVASGMAAPQAGRHHRPPGLAVTAPPVHGGELYFTSLTATEARPARKPAERSADDTGRAISQPISPVVMSCTRSRPVTPSHPGGAYPQPLHAAEDEWTPEERRMLEPPYAWERRDNTASEEWLRSAGPGHMASAGRYREDAQEHPAAPKTQPHRAAGGGLNTED